MYPAQLMDRVIEQRSVRKPYQRHEDDNLYEGDLRGRHSEELGRIRSEGREERNEQETDQASQPGRARG